MSGCNDEKRVKVLTLDPQEVSSNPEQIMKAPNGDSEGQQVYQLFSYLGVGGFIGIFEVVSDGKFRK